MKNRVQGSGRPSSAPSSTAIRPLKTKGWFHVNIGRHEVENLRALAHCLGTNLRTFLELTIRCEAIKEAKELKINHWDAAKIPMAQRKAIARRQQAIYRGMNWRVDAYKN